MTQMPPNVNRIGGTDELKYIVEEIRTAQTKLADYLATITAASHPDIVALLVAEGCDQPGAWGGSSARHVANQHQRIARMIAVAAIGVGKLADAWYKHWLKNVKAPVEAAQAARARTGPALKV